MDHGKNVRAPSLIGGTNYIMKTWGKQPKYEAVRFVEFQTAEGPQKQPTRQLKNMLATDLFMFSGEAGQFRGKMLDDCLVHETTEARITFFEALPGTEVKVSKAKKAAATAPAPKTTPKAAAAAEPAETAQERKNRLRREARKAKKDSAVPETEAHGGDAPVVETEQTDETVAAATVENEPETAIHPENEALLDPTAGEVDADTGFEASDNADAQVAEASATDDFEHMVNETFGNSGDDAPEVEAEASTAHHAAA